jgi:hypothetical protein
MMLFDWIPNKELVGNLAVAMTILTFMFIYYKIRSKK